MTNNRFFGVHLENRQGTQLQEGDFVALSLSGNFLCFHRPGEKGDEIILMNGQKTTHAAYLTGDPEQFISFAGLLGAQHGLTGDLDITKPNFLIYRFANPPDPD